MTREILRRLCIEHGDQWHQHWATETKSDGTVRLGSWHGEMFQWEIMPCLAGKVPSHEFAAMSRCDWFAIRNAHDSHMELYLVRFGDPIVERVESGPAFEEFKVFFTDDSGFLLRDCEWEQLCRESDEIERSRESARRSMCRSL